MSTAFSENKTNEVKKALLESLSHGATVTLACKEAGIGRTYFYKLLQEDLPFRNAVKDSELAAISTVEDALWLKATGGQIAAVIFYLCNRAPDRWRNPMKPDIIAQDEQARAVVNAIKQLMSEGHASIEPNAVTDIQ